MVVAASAVVILTFAAIQHNARLAWAGRLRSYTISATTIIALIFALVQRDALARLIQEAILREWQSLGGSIWKLALVPLDIAFLIMLGVAATQALSITLLSLSELVALAVVKALDIAYSVELKPEPIRMGVPPHGAKFAAAPIAPLHSRPGMLAATVEEALRERERSVFMRQPRVKPSAAREVAAGLSPDIVIAYAEARGWKRQEGESWMKGGVSLGKPIAQAHGNGVRFRSPAAYVTVSTLTSLVDYGVVVLAAVEEIALIEDMPSLDVLADMLEVQSMRTNG